MLESSDPSTEIVGRHPTADAEHWIWGKDSEFTRHWQKFFDWYEAREAARRNDEDPDGRRVA